MDLGKREWCARVRRALVPELDAITAGWTVAGEELRGPGSLAVRVDDLHDVGPGHIDIGYILNREDPSSPVIWDCTAGGRAQDDAAAAHAARVWSATVAPAVIELRAGDGRFAEHSHGDPTLGLAGWHSIHGPIIAYGSGDVEGLQGWLIESPVVPLLGSLLDEALSPGTLHGVKILVGAFDDPIAEVRIDGLRDERCSRALLELPWPRASKGSIARHFVLFVHPTHP